MQNQQVNSRIVSDRTVLAQIPGFLGKPRDVEDLLNWTYGDQMAHAGGAGDEAFTGFGAMGYSDSCLDDHGGGGGGLVPLRPKVCALAEAVDACIGAGLPELYYDRLVVYAARKARPCRGDDPVWFEPPDDRDIGPDGRPRSRFMMRGGVRWDPKQRIRINRRSVAACNVERRGPSPEAQDLMRREYRAWHAALVAAYDSLNKAGFAVLAPAAPGLPMEPWEGWTPRYAKPRDLVRYQRA